MLAFHCICNPSVGCKLTTCSCSLSNCSVYKSSVREEACAVGWWDSCVTGVCSLTQTWSCLSAKSALWRSLWLHKTLCNQYFLIGTDTKWVEYWVVHWGIDYCGIDLDSCNPLLSSLGPWITDFFKSTVFLNVFFLPPSAPILFLHFHALPLICGIKLFCIYLYPLIIAESLGAENWLGLSPSGVFDVPFLMRLAAESRLA